MQREKYTGYHVAKVKLCKKKKVFQNIKLAYDNISIYPFKLELIEFPAKFVPSVRILPNHNFKGPIPLTIRSGRSPIIKARLQ